MKNESTRREFLKYSGTIVLLVGSGCAVPVNGPTAEPKASIQSLSGLPISDGYLIVDTRKCQGCASCMLACSLVHEGVESLSLSRIQIIQNSFAAFPDDVSVEQCRQCVDPACVEACPFSPSRSQLAAAENYEGDDKAYKCDLCGQTPYHWDVAGGGPDGKQACVAVCPVGAIAFTREIPVQKGDEGYKVNLRGSGWAKLGYRM